MGRQSIFKSSDEMFLAFLSCIVISIETYRGKVEQGSPVVGLFAGLQEFILLYTYPFPYFPESKEEGTPLKLKCELCGRVDFAYKFKRSKRFCSMACAKR